MNLLSISLSLPVCWRALTCPTHLYARDVLYFISLFLYFSSCLFLSLTSMASTPPHNFSWVEPGKLAGLAMPRMTSEYQYLLDNGVKHLVCLCERKPPYYDTCPELNLHHIKIADFTPPSPTQIEKFLNIVEDANSKGEVRRRLFNLNPKQASVTVNAGHCSPNCGFRQR